jgi:hypothetical protein
LDFGSRSRVSPGREYWDVFRVSHKRMTRLATFFLDHGVLTEVK